jgi:hypothetical protein
MRRWRARWESHCGMRVSVGDQAVTGPAPLYHWLRDGATIGGATGSELDFSLKGLGDGGLYSVVIDNGIGRVTNAIAKVAVNVPLALSGGATPAAQFEGNEFVFGFAGNAGQDVGIEQSGDLVTWNRSGTVWLSAEGQGEFRDGKARTAAVQMYRAVDVPVHLESDGQVVDGGQLNQAWRVTGGQLGQHYVLEQSGDGGVSWTAVQTNIVQKSDWHFEARPDSKLDHRVRVIEQ